MKRIVRRVQGKPREPIRQPIIDNVMFLAIEFQQVKWETIRLESNTSASWVTKQARRITKQHTPSLLSLLNLDCMPSI